MRYPSGLSESFLLPDLEEHKNLEPSSLVGTLPSSWKIPRPDLACECDVCVFKTSTDSRNVRIYRAFHFTFCQWTIFERTTTVCLQTTNLLSWKHLTSTKQRVRWLFVSSFSQLLHAPKIWSPSNTMRTLQMVNGETQQNLFTPLHIYRKYWITKNILLLTV